jgi:predicted AAA+ superfamily ATPase
MKIRRSLYSQLLEGLQTFPVVALVGPRQVGKTSLARLLMAELIQSGKTVVMLDLERPSDLAKLNDARTVFGPLGRSIGHFGRSAVAPGFVSGAACAGRYTAQAGPVF